MAAGNNGLALQFVHQTLRVKKAVAVAAMENTGMALEHAADRADKASNETTVWLGYTTVLGTVCGQFP